MEITDPPAPTQIEITLFGPGYGECCLVHIGAGNWIIVDSCINNITKKPAPLAYLEGIGVDPKEAVKLIVVSHWDDDHIGGLSQVVEHCTSAQFVLSSALRAPEFVGMTFKFKQGSSMPAGPGVREINAVFEILAERRATATLASDSKLVFRMPGSKTGHGQDCQVWTLSPSSRQAMKALTELSKLMPKAGETKFRCVAQRPNHTTVVIWIEIGQTRFLLGGDLEETGDPKTGWSVIVASATRPPGLATVFKVPHHGSGNAHSNEVWEQMLIANPFAILTPWNRGSKLPTPDDVDRINGLTEKAYSTAILRTQTARRRPQAVEKTLRGFGITVRAAEPRTGAIRLRNFTVGAPNKWDTELFVDACHLSGVHAA